MILVAEMLTFTRFGERSGIASAFPFAKSFPFPRGCRVVVLKENSGGACGTLLLN